MKYVKDLEEKQLLLACHKCHSGKEIIMSNLSTAVEISKILAKNSCTYNDVDKILTDLLEYYKKRA